MSENSETVTAGLRALVLPRRRLLLVLATALLGLVTAIGLASLLAPEQRTFAGIAPLTQLVLSVLTPFATVLLTHDVRESGPDGRASLTGRWAAAAIYGVLVGAYGAVVTALAVSMVISSGAQLAADPWAGTGSAVLGSVVSQLIPVGVGCGAGLLIARPLRAQLATVVAPLAFSFVLARFTPAGTTDWVTPLAAADHLLPGPMTALTWVQWVVTAALWVVLPNLAGARRLRRPAAPVSRSGAAG
ncbi:MAG TPA: hypothetical protein VFU98_14560 [Microlunatus sp.]|nr:hypothetical protein [Microlunatus sp.]